MSEHFTSEQWLPRPLDEVFCFFADARNLERITPAWLRFRILTPAPIEMAVGTRIEYRLRIRGVPLRWESEITAWEPPHRFVDEQRRGPYRSWIHTHSFVADGQGTRILDEVDYSVWGGRVVDRLLVRRDVAKIFDYRHGVISKLLSDTATPRATAG